MCWSGCAHVHRAALQYHQETIQRKKTYLQCRQAGTFLSTGTDCGGGLEEAPGSHPGLEWKLQPKGFLGAERTSGCPPKALDWEGVRPFYHWVQDTTPTWDASGTGTELCPRKVPPGSSCKTSSAPG